MQIGAVYIWTYIFNIIRAYGTPRMESSTDIMGSGFLDSCREALISSHSLKYDQDEEAQVVLEEEEVGISTLLFIILLLHFIYYLYICFLS